MRARDFIPEGTRGTPHKDHANVQQTVRISRDQGGYDRVYHQNRLMMAMGMADGQSTKPVDMDPASWVEKYNTVHPYTDVEDKMFQQAAKTIPTDHHVVSKGKSKEPEDTHTVSPVANWMKKK